MKRISVIMVLLILCGCTHNSLTLISDHKSNVDDVEFEGYTDFLEFNMAHVLSRSTQDFPPKPSFRHPFWMPVIISDFDGIYCISFLNEVADRRVVYETYIDGSDFSIVDRDIAKKKAERYLVDIAKDSSSDPLMPIVMTCDLQTIQIIDKAITDWFKQFPNRSTDNIKLGIGNEGTMYCVIFYDMNVFYELGEHSKVYELYFTAHPLELIERKIPTRALTLP